MDEKAFALTLSCALALLACGEPPPRAPDQWPITPVELGMNAAPAEPGELAYNRTCLACHGGDGKGNGAKTGADFTSTEGVLTKPDAQLLTSILNGTQGSIGVMPPHRALLSDAEASAVLAYVRSRFGTGIAPRAPEAATPDPGAEAVQPVAGEATAAAP